MQVLAPIMLYNAEGQGMVVYAPSTLTATMGAPVPPANGVPPTNGMPQAGMVNIPAAASPQAVQPGPVVCAPFQPQPQPTMLNNPAFTRTPPQNMGAQPMPTNTGPIPTCMQPAMPPQPSNSLPPFSQPPPLNYAQRPALPMPMPTLASPTNAGNVHPIVQPAPRVQPASPIRLPAPVAPHAAPMAVPAPPMPNVAAVEVRPPVPANYAKQLSNTGTNVYIANLPRHVTKEGLQDLFSPYGVVVSTRVARKPGQPPIGFVQFASPDMAQSAVAAVNGMMLEEGQCVKVKIADHDKDKGVISGPSSDLYICNLPKTWSYAELHSIFSNYGRILSLTTFKESSAGSPFGSGMVRFSNTTEASAAIKGLNQLMAPGMERPLEVKYAESRADKERRVVNRMKCTKSEEDATAEIQVAPQPEAPQVAAPPMVQSWNELGQLAPKVKVQKPVSPIQQKQDMSAVREFSRLMNLAAEDAKQSLMSASTGLRRSSEENLTSSDSSDGLSSEESDKSERSSQTGSDEPSFTFWDSVQDLLQDMDDFDDVSVPMVYKAPSLRDACMASQMPSSRATRNKRKQRRPVASRPLHLPVGVAIRCSPFASE